jgi:hypothetical protein
MNGSSVRLYGLGFRDVTRVVIADEAVPITYGNASYGDQAVQSALNSAPWPAQVKTRLSFDYIEFAAPSIVEWVNRQANESQPTHKRRKANDENAFTPHLQADTHIGTDSRLPVVRLSDFPPRRSHVLFAASSSVDVTSPDVGHLTTNLHVEFANGYTFDYSLGYLLFYTRSTCLKEGEWKEDRLGGSATRKQHTIRKQELKSSYTSSSALIAPDLLCRFLCSHMLIRKSDAYPARSEAGVLAVAGSSSANLWDEAKQRPARVTLS